MAHYQFESEWALTAPIESVYELLAHPEDFSEWWPSVKRSQPLEEGDEDGVGARASYSLRSPLLYSMDFETRAVDVQHPRRIHNLVRGDLVGTGTYLLDSRGAGTTVHFSWHVSTTKTWMNIMAPVAKPLFVWAHHHVMREGATAMASCLGAKLLSIQTRLEEGHRRKPAVESQS